MSAANVPGATLSSIDREFAENHIREITSPAERGHYLAIAAPMLEWRWTPGIASFPYLNRAWVGSKGWVTGLKYWGDAFGHDEQAWCKAAGLVSPAQELVGVIPEPKLDEATVYRLPLSPWPINRFLSPHSLSVALLFPEDLGFVLYKDDRDTLVPAGPPTFVKAALPEGPEAAEAQYRAYAADERHEATRRLMVEMADRYGAVAW